MAGCRLIWRLVLLVMWLPVCLLEIGLIDLVGRGSVQVFWRAEAARRWSGILLWLAGVCVKVDGPVVGRGLVVSNHNGYLDALVLGSLWPMVFVAKSDVAGWPIVGWMVRGFGALFVRRGLRSDVRRLAVEMEGYLRRGMTVCYFPEGTSSDGSGVLRFYSGLFESAVRSGACVRPVGIRFEGEDGELERAAYYYGNDNFLRHFLRLLGSGGIVARVVVGELIDPRGSVRGEIAEEAWRRVCRLCQQ